MSTYFFIAPYDPSAWKDPDASTQQPTSDLTVEPQQSALAILKRWPLVQIQPAAGAHPLTWLLPSGRPGLGRLRGHLHRNLQVVEFGTGPKEIFLDFILWHRTCVADHSSLFLFNSSAWDSLVLTLQTTKLDL